MIRGKLHKCPFGLSIPIACNNIGGLFKDGKSAINSMIPIDPEDSEDAEDIMRHNIDQLFLISKPGRCPYADRIFDEKKSVDCKYDEYSEEIPAGSAGLEGSPNYPHIMVGQMPKAQYGYPKGYSDYYADDNSANIYYGIYGLIG